MDNMTGKFMKFVKVRSLKEIAGEGYAYRRDDQNEGVGQSMPDGFGTGGSPQPAPFRFNMGLPGAGKPHPGKV